MANKLQFLKGTGALPTDRIANNIYFKLGDPGEGQIALGENIWNESVQIKDGDNVLAYSAVDGLSASVSLTYDLDNKKIKLVGKDNANLGEIDATAFLKDGMLESASFENNKLIFVFNTDAGKTQIEVPVASLVDEYTAGNGLSLNGKEFSVKVAGESFLSVDAEGVKLSGVQSAINAAKDAAISEANAAKAAAAAVQTYVDALEVNVQGIDADLTTLEGVVSGHVADAVAHITADERSAWNAAESNAKTYADGKFQVKGDYEAAGAASDALASAKEYADDVAADAEANANAYAKEYADGLATNYDKSGSASAALESAKEYADGLAVNYDDAGAADGALTSAKAYAKEYADSLDKAMDSRVDELEAKKHEHANKATLDTITAEKVSNWDDAVSKEHIHSNKEVLDAITYEKVSNWDGSLASAKSYADGVADDAKDAAISAAATDAATKYQVKGNYEDAGAAADALASAKEYADDVAADAEKNAISAAAADAATKANTAKSEAISAAAADATSKANAAQTAAISAAEGKVNAAKDTIDAYTVNGKAISANPVLNGGEIKLDGFTAVSQASDIVASDTINSAIAKLEKSIADVSAAAVKLGTQEGNVVLTIDEATKGLSAHLEWGEF